MNDFFKKAGDKIHQAEETVINEIGHIAGKAERRAKRIVSAATHFLHMEASGGIILVFAALTAVIIANSPLFAEYDYILNEIKFRIGFADIQGSFDYEIRKSLLLWINDGFMAVFFFLIGLEIKREIMGGELSSRARALLPALAAIGGMAAPALFFWFVNQDTPENMRGWAIPAATDIAFALGVLALLGSRAPTRLKILLTAIAVIDDLLAILVIAFFYTETVNIEPLYFGLAALVLLALINRFGVSILSPYILLGIILWVAVLKSGVHATLAGVVTALFIPMSCKKNPDFSPCTHLEHKLHPWVAFAILPIFAFANAGVPFEGMGLHSLGDPLTLGIIVGLTLGKQLGIFTLLVLTIKSGLSPMPRGVTWIQLYAVSVLCGIGFTMSLFIGSLAFEGDEAQASIRLGVLTASLISAVLGYCILRFCPAKQETLNESKEIA